MSTLPQVLDGLYRRPLAPELPSGKLVGHLTALREDSVGLMVRAYRERGDVARIRVGPVVIHSVFHPRDVERVLVENHANYTKQTRGYDTLRIFLGQGLVTSEGDFWRRQRRIAQPAFARAKIAALGAMMEVSTTDMAEEWEARAASGEPFDVAGEMMRLTLRIAGLTLFGKDLKDGSDEVGQAVSVMLERFTVILKSMLPLWWPSRGNRRGNAAMATLDRVVYEIIAERRKSPAERPDLLSMLMEAKDEETGEGMSDRQLRDEVMTMLVAGHETTANALAWTFYLLAQHPEVATRVEEEIDRVLGDERPSADRVRSLTYTDQVLSESMRLYPPVWAVARRAAEPDVLGGYAIPKDAYVIMCPYVTHRHPSFWKDPEVFDPDRFAPETLAAEKASGRPKYAYYPFAGGPRKCIGDHFARMEALIGLAGLLQRYRVSLAPGQKVVAEPSVTLRPRSGIQVTVTRRERTIARP